MTPMHLLLTTTLAPSAPAVELEQLPIVRHNRGRRVVAVLATLAVIMGKAARAGRSLLTPQTTPSQTAMAGLRQPERPPF